MIPYTKLSKKERAKLNKEKRVTWGFSPVSRVKPSKKAYNRKKGGNRYNERTDNN